MNKLNLVSGTRPTGQLHLGHYMGVLRNWKELQDSDKYNCFFFIADWHSLTTKYSEVSEQKNHILEVAKDFLASGIDPNKSHIYVQSAIPEIAELHLLFSMITPNNWVERDPTLKDLVKAAQNSQINELSYGMLGYPILQTADILMFRGALVPVGKDQEAHIEISRDIARRFNNTFKSDFFPEPKALFTETPTLKGIDGNKMSKSFNNDIKIAATEEETIKQAKKMLTDAQRQKLTDPGDVSRCEVAYKYYEIFASEEIQNTVKEECHSAQRGCVACKKELGEIINNYFAEIREKRAALKDADVWDILNESNKKAKIVAQENISQIREILKVNYN